MAKEAMYRAADDLIHLIKTSGDQHVCEEKSVEVDVNGLEAAGFTIRVNGTPYCVCLLERTS